LFLLNLLFIIFLFFSFTNSYFRFPHIFYP